MTEDRELDARLAALAALPPPPKDVAVVAKVVQRRPNEGRNTPATVILDTEEGVLGDEWSAGERDVEAQVTLMRADVAEVLCRVDGYEVYGDNLFATIDTSAENLPPGTVLRIGTARCAVTSKPHLGCDKFEARSLPRALAATLRPDVRSLQLRGVHLRVLDRGIVAAGDRIEVESRP